MPDASQRSARGRKNPTKALALAGVVAIYGAHEPRTRRYPAWTGAQADRPPGARRRHRARKASAFGATGHAVGEVCFNTAMTGYEEILTDPSYAGQIITFTFPHIGNVGTNEEDIETVNMAATPGARGVILHSAITHPSNYRATRHLDQWLKRPRHHRAVRPRHARADGPDPHQGHAQCGDRARAVGPVRPRCPEERRRASGPASSAWTSSRW